MQIKFLNRRGASHLGRTVNLDNPTGSNQPLDLRWNCNNIVLGLLLIKKGLAKENWVVWSSDIIWCFFFYDLVSFLLLILQCSDSKFEQHRDFPKTY